MSARIVITSPNATCEEVVFVTPPQAPLPYVAAINFMLGSDSAAQYELFRCPDALVPDAGQVFEELPASFTPITDVRLGSEPTPSPLTPSAVRRH